MKLFKNFSFKKLLFNKKFSIALSILVAFVFWLIIVLDQNPEMERSLHNVPVEITTEDTLLAELGLEVVGEIDPQATVTVFGPNYIVSSLKNEDIRIIADLNNVNDSGTYQIKLSAVRNSNDSGYEFREIEPSTITVKFDYFDTKQFTIVPDVSGYEKVNDLTYGDAVVTNKQDSTISVKGPRNDIAKIDKVIAQYYTDKKISTTTSFNGDVKFIDKNGQELDKSKFEYDKKTVSISVPVYKTKVFDFNHSYINFPNNNVILTLNQLIKKETETFEVKGPPDVIDTLDSIEFTPIDVSRISLKNGVTSFELAPILPNGVNMTNGIQAISVSFDSSVLADKRIKVTNIIAEGEIPDGFTVKFPNQAYVDICGHKTAIATLNSDDIYLSVDLSNITKGVSFVKATVKTKNQLAVWQSAPCEIKVDI